MDVTLFRNFSVDNVFTKNITTVATYPAVQVVNPTDDYDVQLRMTASSHLFKWDYVNYFQFDGAYYFLESVEHEANNISILNGRMDLLMTYADSIITLQVLAERSTSHGSPRLEDQNRTITADSTRTVINFPNPIPGGESSGVYILTTAQSGYSTT